MVFIAWASGAGWLRVQTRGGLTATHSKPTQNTIGNVSVTECHILMPSPCNIYLLIGRRRGPHVVKPSVRWLFTWVAVGKELGLFGGVVLS